MKKGILGIVILALVLISLAACTQTAGTTPAAATAAAPAATVNIPTQAQGGGSASLGIAVPVLPSQGVSGGGTVSSAQSAIAAAPPQTVAAPNMAIASPGYYYSQPAYNNQVQNTGIWVTGQGMVSVVPDIATLTLGVNAQASRVADAQTEAAGAMSTIITLLKSKGIADADITTVGFNIYPVMDYKNNTITGYQVNNAISVKIRTISNSGPIIDAVTAAAGNLIRVNGISFDISDPAPFLKQARQQAMADANAKAAQLASLGGVKLGPPTYITESTGSYVPQPVYFGASNAMAAPAVSTPINPGQTQVSVNVQVVYGIQ